MKQIDFKTTGTAELFFRIFIPTLWGMLFTTSLVVIDGIFVGRGIGSDALAAVNISLPPFMIATGIGLMFGIGSSVTASIHLAKTRVEAACMCLTHSLVVSIVFTGLLSVLTLIFDEQVALFSGGSEQLFPLILEYMHIFVSFVFLQILLTTGQFIIRLDGSPGYAMMCNVIPAIINIVLDYVFIFIFDLGLAGAAWATVLGLMAGALLFFYYMAYCSRTLGFKSGGLSCQNLKLAARNISKAAGIGFSAMLGELAISCTFFMGNHAFIRALGEDGVASFSVVCYLFPLIYMTATAITQSVQPIISFNFGNHDWLRISGTLRLSLLVGVVISVLVGFAFFVYGPQIVSLFLAKTTTAHEMAVYGMPYFAAGFIFFVLNMVMIGFYQSIERPRPATVFTVLRGFVFMAACFAVLPGLLGVKGIWLAVPAAEFMTCLIIFVFHVGTGKGYIKTAAA